jgi:N-acetyl-gamma-glutamyl-phosphate reductase
VKGSNHVFLNVVDDRVPGRAILMVAIDNVVKGASGQAVQNFNLLFDLGERSGLENPPMFP